MKKGVATVWKKVGENVRGTESWGREEEQARQGDRQHGAYKEERNLGVPQRGTDIETLARHQTETHSKHYSLSL